MALTIFGLQGRPHDFAVSRTAESADTCAFLLDFSRPIVRFKQLFGKPVKHLGIVTYLHVPVVYIAEDFGGFVIGISRGEPYFKDFQDLWRKHQGNARTTRLPPQGGIATVAAFATHFPEDSKSPSRG